METTVLPPETELPSKRADMPVIWEDFRSQLAKLEATAQTLVVAKKAKAAPDKQKIETFAAAVRALGAPECGTSEGKAISTQIADQITKFAVWVEKQANTL